MKNGRTSLQHSNARYVRCNDIPYFHTTRSPSIGLKTCSTSSSFPLDENPPVDLHFADSRSLQYFSSLERLRLAQGPNSRPIKAASLSRVKSSKRDVSSRPPRPTLARRNSSYFKNPAFRRKIPSPTSDTFSHSDAQWFLRLPEKVQRRHFTLEERNLLSGQTGAVLPDAADAADAKFGRELYKLSREKNRSVPALRTSSFTSQSSSSTFDPGHPVDSAIEMDNSMIWFDDDNDVDLDSRLQLDDYHEFIDKAADKNNNNRQSRRGPSFRRALSISSLPFHANHSSLPKSSPPPLPTLSIPQGAHQRTHSRKQPSPPSFHIKQTSVSAVEPSARHYQDPEARLKLRVYLASPQKFDEAIEFGFPSMDDKELLPMHRPSLSRSHNTAPCKTFFHDDAPSIFDNLDLSDDNDSDAASLPERDAPYTPMDAAFHTDAILLSPSDATSSESSNTLYSRPTVRHYTSDPFAQLLAGSREMTLRMTLTRPDLRADEKALYAHTTGDDPLALEHLPPTKNEADIWDTLPKDQSVVKRFWRKVSGKS